MVSWRDRSTLLSARRFGVTMTAEEAIAVLAPHSPSVTTPPLVSAIAPRLASGLLARCLLKVVPLVFRAAPHSAEPLLSPVPLLARPLPYYGAQMVLLALVMYLLLPPLAGARTQYLSACSRMNPLTRREDRRLRRLPPHRPSRCSARLVFPQWRKSPVDRPKGHGPQVPRLVL